MSVCRIIRCGEEDAFAYLAKRSAQLDTAVSEVVAGIIEDVRKRGDSALLDSARRFDSPNISSILVTEKEIEQAEVAPARLTAIQHAISRVRRFHEAQLSFVVNGWAIEMTPDLPAQHHFDSWAAPTGREELSEGRSPGNSALSSSESPVGAARFAGANAPSSQSAQPTTTFSWQIPEPHGGHIGQRLRPLASAGIYVPGGKARYPSSVIMNGIPALVAGVNKITICSPAGPDGCLSAPVLVAARKCGITKIAKTGGAAAVAALAYGTESVSKVAKIAGPGNRYVNEAKRQLWGMVGLDLYAGPSEVCVLVDDDANPEFAVADWLTQVEHAEDNAGFIVCPSESKLAEIMAAVERQLSGAPREHTMRQALADYGAAFVARDLQEAIEIVNAIAPEHLTLAVANPEETAARIENAGCILLGEYTPESAGDYAIGPSHTLPTSTAARFASPLNVLDFMKLQSLSNLTKEDLKEISSTIETFGEMEGFPAHANGARIRK